MKIELKDPASVRKMQHMVLAMERIAQLLDQQSEIEITIKIGSRPRWWRRKKHEKKHPEINQ
jgi:phage gpG-like protein